MLRRWRIEWLQGELTRLVGAGQLDEASAERLRAHYQEELAASARPLGLAIFGTLGAILVALGIQLLFAHNWDFLSRPVRAAVSIALLLVAQGFAGWVLVRRRDSVPWREGAATFLGLAAGTTLALVSQTYHVQTDVATFLLVWSLLGLPLVFLFDSYLVAALYAIGITGWAGARYDEVATVVWCWPLFAPAFLQLARGARSGQAPARTWLLAATLAICLPFGAALSAGRLDFATHLALLAIFGIYATALGRPSSWRLLFAIAGYGGMTYLALWNTLRYECQWDRVAPWADAGAGAELALAAIASAIAVYSFTRRRLAAGILAAGPAAFLVAWALYSRSEETWPGLLVMNVYALLLGIAPLVAGLREKRLLLVNLGMAVLASLIAVRFFDSEVSFTLRGIGFIAVGIAFLAVNVVWVRRSREAR